MSLRNTHQMKLAKCRGGMVSEAPAECWSPAYVLEIKFDGVRESLEFTSSGGNILQGRNKHGKLKGVEHSSQQEFVRSSDFAPHLRDLVVPELVGSMLDGELVWGDDAGSATTIEARGHQTYFVFDVLFWKGVDVRGLAWERRRLMVEEAVAKIAHPKVVASKVFAATKEVYKELMKDAHEGAVLKLKTGTYGTGTYGEGWWKAKAEDTVDAVIMDVSQARRGGSPKNGVKPQPIESAATVTVGMFDKEGVLVEVGKASFPPEQRPLADAVWKDFLAYKGKVVEMNACGYNARHFRWCEVVRVRDDKPADECLLTIKLEQEG